MKEQHQILLLLCLSFAVAVAALLSMIFFTTLPEIGFRDASDITLWTLVFALLLAVVTVLQPGFIFYRLWHQYGRESDPVVPDHLSFAPTGSGTAGMADLPVSKPWVVNLLFAGDPMDFDENGFYATLLDLQRRGLLEITSLQEGAVRYRVKVADPDYSYESENPSSPLDSYEAQVIRFLRRIGPGGVIERGKIPAGAGRNLYGDALPDRDYMRYIVSTCFTDGRFRLIPFTLNAVFLYSALLFALAWPAALLILALAGGFIFINWLGAYSIFMDAPGTSASSSMGVRKAFSIIVLSISLVMLFLFMSIHPGLASLQTPEFGYTLAIVLAMVVLLTMGALIMGDPKGMLSYAVAMVSLLILAILIYLVAVPDTMLLVISVVSAVSLVLLFRSILLKRVGMAVLSTGIVLLAGIPAILSLLHLASPAGSRHLQPGVFLVPGAFAVIMGVFVILQYILVRREFTGSIQQPYSRRLDQAENTFYVLYLLIFLFFFLQGFQSGAVLVILAFLMIGQYFIALSFPSSLFGQWRGDMHQKKVEWDAFRNMLSDFAMIRKYAPQDLSMWGEWLVFGTALGVGDKVTRAMREIGFEIPGIILPPDLPFALESNPEFRITRWWNRFWGA